MIDPFDRSRLVRERVDLVSAEELVRLIEANDRPIRIIWFVIEVEHPFMW